LAAACDHHTKSDSGTANRDPYQVEKILINAYYVDVVVQMLNVELRIQEIKVASL